MATNIPAVFGLNKFLWNKIQEQGILDTSNYGGLIPIIPIQEEPTLLSAIHEQPGITSAPYIIYTYYNNGVDQTWWETYDQVIYVVNSLDQGKLRELTLLIQKYFKRYDESARLVNSYIQNPANGLSADYTAYEYKYIQVFASTGGAPVSMESEPIKATVTLRVCYTNSNNDTALS